MSPKKTVRISPEDPDIIDSPPVEEIDLSSSTPAEKTPAFASDKSDHGMSPATPSFSQLLGDVPNQEPGGELVKLGDIDAYVSKPADYPHTPARLLVLLTGGNGIRVATNQLLADRFAAHGFLVVMPDQFHGNPMPHIVLDKPSTKPTSFTSRLFGTIGDLAKGFKIDRWFAFHTAEHAAPAIIEAITHAIELYPDSVERKDDATIVSCAGVLIGAKNAAFTAGLLEQQRIKHEAFISNPNAKPDATEPVQPLFLIRKLAFATPSLLVSSNLADLAAGSAVQIVGRFGDAIIEDCPAPQADPYARLPNPDPEAGTSSDSAEQEANESLPIFTDLRSRGVSVNVRMFDRSLPDAFILNPGLDTLTPSAREEVRIRSEDAISQMAHFIRSS